MIKKSSSQALEFIYDISYIESSLIYEILYTVNNLSTRAYMKGNVRSTMSPVDIEQNYLRDIVSETSLYHRDLVDNSL